MDWRKGAVSGGIRRRITGVEYFDPAVADSQGGGDGMGR